GGSRNGRLILEVDSLLGAPPGQGAIHGTGVEVGEVKALRNCSGDGGLAGAGRAVDGNDEWHDEWCSAGSHPTDPSGRSLTHHSRAWFALAGCQTAWIG